MYKLYWAWSRMRRERPGTDQGDALFRGWNLCAKVQKVFEICKFFCRKASFWPQKMSRWYLDAMNKAMLAEIAVRSKKRSKMSAECTTKKKTPEGLISGEKDGSTERMYNAQQSRFTAVQRSG